jgi:hypothetical protein
MARQICIPTELRQQVEDTCYQYALVYKSSPDDAKFKGDVLAPRREQTNIQSLLMQVDAQTLRPHVLDALIAFSLYQSRTKPSTVVGLYAFNEGGARCPKHAPDCRSSGWELSIFGMTIKT